MAEIIRAGGFAGPGERRTAIHFQQKLPDSWVVICGKQLVSHTGVQEVDFIILGDHCVFAVEEKYWRGTIYGNSNGWVRAGESQGSPLGQAGAAARRLAGMLRDISYIRQARLGHFVFPRVIMSHPEVELHLRDPRADEEVLRLNGSEKHLVDFDRTQDGPDSIRPFRGDIKALLTKLDGRPAVPERIGSFIIEETLPPTRFTKVFRARHELGGARLLKLVKKPASLDATTFEAEKAALLREYDVMQDLAETGRVPRVDAAFTWEEDYWVLPTYPLPGRTLRADAAQSDPPDEERVRSVVMDALRAMSVVHDHGITHRALNPDRIVLGDDGRIRFVDFFIARVAGSQTIADHVVGLDRPDDPYRAPECQLDLALAEPTSDVYGLCASLLTWISRQEPEGEPGHFPSVTETRSDLPAGFAETLDLLLRSALDEDERQRPTAAQLVEDADDLWRAESPPVASEEQGTTTPVSVTAPSYEPDSMVDDQHRVIRQLGSGGSATTYLARDLEADEDVVLKVIRSPEFAARLARNEFRILRDLHHPHIPRVFDIRPATSPFHLKMAYVRGVSLREVAEDYRDPIAALTIAQAVASALTYVDEQGLVHRDVSPANILVPTDADETIHLIDFGIAAVDDHQVSQVGTPRYRAPEIDRGGEWSHSSDIYSLAVVVYELLTGSLPYETDDRGVPHKSERISVDLAADQLGSRALAQVLLGAVDPDPNARPTSAAELAEALRVAMHAPPSIEPSEGDRRINPFVDELRSAYRNTRGGNAGNRALESEFARSTYVETRLDTELLPAMLGGEVRIVILSGNPGDGKTTFLQQLETQLLAAGAQQVQSDEAGWRYTHNGRSFHAVYDASESHGDLSADDLLHAALEPVEEGDAYTAAIAANDGRLIDFFTRFGATYYPEIWEQLREQLQGETPAADAEILLVDLKRRSLASLRTGEESLFGRVLDTFVAPDRWAMCDGCIAREDCPILSNARSLGKDALGGGARRHLERMTLAVHLRRERRPTVRDLRSALAFAITADQGCTDVHQMRDGGRSALGEQGSAYFVNVVEPRPERDLLLDEWCELDPALVSTPHLDRHLYFHREPRHVGVLRPLFRLGERVRLDLAIPALTHADWLTHTKRRYAFEVDVEAARAQSLPTGKDLLPYRYFDDFVDALEDSDQPGLLARVLLGISIAEGAPPSAAQGGLALIAAGGVSRELQVVKKLGAEEFTLTAGRSEERFAEGVPDELVLRHSDGAVLSITLDLFEFLLRSAAGAAASAEEQRAMVEDLAIFKHRLLAARTEEVRVIEGGRREHRIRVVNHKLVREQGVEA